MSSLCKLSTNAALLRPLALWCLDVFGDTTPMLIGVVLGQSKVQFHPIELDESDPLADIEGLAAPDEWAAIVVVAPTEVMSTHHSGTVAHAIDSFGNHATELDEACGHRRSLHTVGGRLHQVCVAMFDRW